MNPVYILIIMFVAIVATVATESIVVGIIGGVVVLGLYLHLGLSLRSPNESNRRSLSDDDDDDDYYIE